MWSAIPVALLCMIVNWSEGKQGSGPEGDKVLYNTGGLLFVRPSVIPSVPQALSGLKSALSVLISTLSGLKSALSSLESKRAVLRFERADSRPEIADSRPERADFRPERVDIRPEREDFRPERAWGDKRNDRRTNEQKSPYVVQDFVPFGAAAQKEKIPSFESIGH